MTYRSESRGILYTAPPGPDDENEPGVLAGDEGATDEPPAETTGADVAERESATPGPNADPTDAVLADD